MDAGSGVHRLDGPAELDLRGVICHVEVNVDDLLLRIPVSQSVKLQRPQCRQTPPERKSSACRDGEVG